MNDSGWKELTVFHFAEFEYQNQLQECLNNLPYKYDYKPSSVPIKNPKHEEILKKNVKVFFPDKYFELKLEVVEAMNKYFIPDQNKMEDRLIFHFDPNKCKHIKKAQEAVIRAEQVMKESNERIEEARVLRELVKENVNKRKKAKQVGKEVNNFFIQYEIRKLANGLLIK